MHYAICQVVWDDFATSLQEARDEVRRKTREESGTSRLSAREKLFVPVEKVFRHWVQRHYGYDPWVFDPRRSDVFQQVYLCAWRNFEQFKGNSQKEFLAWISKILNNELNQIFRRGQHERQFFSELGSATYAKEPAAEPSLLEQLVRLEERRVVRQAFEHLPEDYQQILVLRYENCLGYEEIGARMHRSTDAARMLCSRARLMLYHLVGGETSEDNR